MFCGNCGSPNPETEARCTSCGASLSADVSPSTTVGPYGAIPTAAVPNHLVFAIVMTAIGAMSCLPVAVAGALGIYYATQVTSKLATGDIQGAMAASRSARTCSIVGVVMTVVTVVLMIGVVAAVVIAEGI